MKTRTVFLVACAAMLASCTPAGPAAKPVTEVTLSETETTILIDEEKALTATVLPSDATDKTVSWTSSDDRIATVNGGKVTGIAEGTATITATAGGKSASCKVYVKTPTLVITGDVVGITYSSATVSYRILFKYAPAGAKLEQAGILYGKSPNLVVGTDLFYGIPRDKDENPDMSGSYTAEPYNLDEETTYYYQAFARFDGVDYFGDVRSFVTQKLNISADKLVDMGLSVKWAGWNVGATKPEEFGDYFVWGHAEKVNSCWFYWYDTSTKLLTKYNSHAEYGAVDRKTVLDLEDDPAAYNWDEKWRTPTNEEKLELLQNTEQTEFTYHGVPGWIFTSKKNGATIFFPAAGYKSAVIEKTVNDVGKITAFWSSTVNDKCELGAYFACSNVYDTNFEPESSFLYNAGFYWEAATSHRQVAVRYWGMSVRAVWDENRPELQYPTELICVKSTDVTHNSATLHGRIKDFFRNGRTVADLPELGFCLVKKDNGNQATINDIKITCTSSDGSKDGYDYVFSKKVTGLDTETSYWYNVYTMSGTDVKYSECNSFKTDLDWSTRGLDLTLQAVDLGLPSGIKWAGWNIGATKFSELGDEFQWGEVKPGECTDANGTDYYKWYDYTANKYTKYVLSDEASRGAVDNLKRLEPCDDAATANWGSDWRMPTEAEWKELLDNTQKVRYYYTGPGGTNGWLFTGPNGKSIFIVLKWVSNSSGVYNFWTADRYDIPDTVWDTGFVPYISSGFKTDESRDCYAHVRAVTEK